ncbi:glycosyl transferase family 2 [Melghirimyces profundicolus]|uniref:Glycosyl transferase family 2 n=1 Tax=Melghirimyces profundicolus TaxID=1242148 RepID=A0A2T6C4Q3_9BACL|nr:glycosyltransferase [Melghirimyces profundicolus]PTX63272.1 glycosyl transferase family 2 [Melghirimyces profundicolus]
MEGVSVITCTIRPNQIHNVYENYARQMFKKKELIIILNRKNMDLHRWLQMAKNFNNVRVYQIPGVPLGVCLNFGIRKARYSFIAKFDDDDYYAPKYLTQAVHALKTTRASLVGKDAHTTYFEGKKLIAVFRPHKQNRYTNHVGGGTFVFKKNVFPHVQFPARTLGEDIIFQQRLRRKGYKIYSTDRYYYVSIRRKNKRTHTWKEKDEKGLRYCKIIARSENYRSYV